MKYKVLICLLLVLFNLLYSIYAQYYSVLHFEKNLLIINSVLIILAAAFYIWQRHSELRRNKLSLSVAEPELSLQYIDQLIVNHFPGFLCLKDKDGRWLKASPNYLELLHLQDVAFVGKTDLELAGYPNCNKEVLKISAIQDKSTWHLRQPMTETRTFARPGKPGLKWLITRTPIFDENNEQFRLIIATSISEAPDTDEEKERLKLIAHVFNVSHLCFALLDSQFTIKKVNVAFSNLTGYHSNELQNKPLSAIILSEDNAKLKLSHADFFKAKDQKYYCAEMACKPKSGQLFPVKLDITLINRDSYADLYFVTLSDITRQKMAEKRILQIAHYDDLTGLANRVMFFERLGQFLSTSQRYSLHAVVFFIDLDRFKAVNDSMGHDAGDELLKETAKRLLSITRKGDVVARLSGDEFAVLLFNEKTHEQAIYSASLVAKKIIQNLSEVFFIQRREVFIGSSIGISIYPEDGTSGEVLIKNADIAMYEAKKQGRNNYQFYKKDFTVATQDRLTLELNLRKAIERNELQLYYQPQYKADDRHMCGAEVLIRWFHGGSDQKKMIPPQYFIPIAEDTSLIIDIGRWILRTACTQLKAWLDEGYPLQQISVNISARQFSDPNFLQVVEDALKDTGLHPKYLELEITESMLIGDTKRIELQLNHLKKMGISLALDDFGTGYSSLSYLKNFPIDILKIDQSFVREMTSDSKDARIACAIIDMGHSLGHKIVAEGVETEEQLLYLLQKECDIIQGYFFSPPVSSQKMIGLLRAEQNETHLEKVKREDFFG